MALVRTVPGRSLTPLPSEVSRLFNSLFDTATPIGAPLARYNPGFVPALDVIERETEYRITVDLPGMSESDVKVEVLEDTLTISGERVTSGEESREGYRRIERASGSFSRTLTLPKGIAPASIHATFKHGVLEVIVPKPESAKPQQVQIAVEAAS